MCVEKLDDYERKLVAVKFGGDTNCPGYITLVFSVSPYSYQYGISWFFVIAKTLGRSRVFS
jgi:hypothetical protein